MLFCHHIFFVIYWSYEINGKHILVDGYYKIQEMHRFRSDGVDGAFCHNSIGCMKYRETLTTHCVIWVIVVARFFPLQRNVLNLNHELSSSSPGIVIVKLKRRSSCYKFTFIEVILWQQWHRIQHCKKSFFFYTKFMFLYIKCRMKRRTFNAKCY